MVDIPPSVRFYSTSHSRRRARSESKRKIWAIASKLSNNGLYQAFSSLLGHRHGGGPAKPAIPLQKPNMIGFLPSVCCVRPTPRMASRSRILKCHNDLGPFAPSQV